MPMPNIVKNSRDRQEYEDLRNVGGTSGAERPAG